MKLIIASGAVITIGDTRIIDPIQPTPQPCERRRPCWSAKQQFSIGWTLAIPASSTFDRIDLPSRADPLSV